MNKDTTITSPKKIIIKSFSYEDPVAYIEHIDTPSHQVKFTEKLSVSHINSEIVQRLGKMVRDRGLHFVVFSGSWCKDCQEIIPILAKINQVTRIPMKIVAGAKLNLMNSPKWGPPSPPEMNEFNIEKIPAILILDTGNHELARFYERPPPGKSLEHVLLDLVTGIVKS
ncbi:MAG TPA: thioredoxin family protein [Candidatus Lokiarchaeia archaeon]|nr:thioredoxin family protein [Candidatus Lokiarchaeia archaeon]